MKHHAALNLIVGTALGLLVPWPGQGQLLQGTIDGNVVDSTQAALVSAQVRATNQETNFTREAATNNAGR